MGHKKFLKVNDMKKVKIRFTDLPISKYTIKGLTKAEYVKMTEVQRCTIPHSLANRDMLVCSRTGSGKTLSYLIPMVEKLYRSKWGALDGLGALVIVPVRELAIQTFEVLRSFASLHDMSAGMIIGGKNVDIEKSRIASMNILVATPGRLLQHLNETPYFDCDNLQVLVLDEVDRILDMGFKEELNQILRCLPMKKVQKLLFSATAKKSLEKYARETLSANFSYFSLNNYEDSLSQALESSQANNEDITNYEDNNKMTKTITPIKLTHFYMCLEGAEKLDTLFSFIKSHKDSKCIVFFSSCKQVRHAYESFSKLKTGATIMEIHGRQKQAKRTAIYFEFVERKKAYLFATDIASRGIDFPAVDWVIQVDIPEDTDTYIHRVGRTARYKYKGSSLLMVQPSEMKFVEKLSGLGVNMKKLKANPNRTLSITSALQRINAENSDLNHLAQKAFVCYIRSIFKNSDKEIFDVKKIDHKALATSLGLVTTPVIQFLEGDEKKDQKNEKVSKLQRLRQKIKEKKLEKQRELQEAEGEGEQEGDSEDVQDDEDEDIEGEDDVEDVSVEDSGEEQPEEDDEDLFTVKRTIVPDEDLEEDKQFEPKTSFSKNQLKKIKKGGISQGKNKIMFGAGGKPVTSLEYHLQNDKFKGEDTQKEEIQPEEYFAKIKNSLSLNKEVDAKIAAERLQKLRQKRKRQRQERELLAKGKGKEYVEEGEGEGEFEGEGDEEIEQVEHKRTKKDNKKGKKEKRVKVKEESEEESSSEPEDL